MPSGCMVIPAREEACEASGKVQVPSSCAIRSGFCDPDPVPATSSPVADRTEPPLHAHGEPPTVRRWSRRGTVLCLIGLVLAGAFSYASYVARGGLASDDWALLAEITQPAKGGWWHAVEGLWDRADYRPVSVAYYSVVFQVLGANGTLNLLWSVAVTIAFAGALFAVLRTAGIPKIHAFAVGALVLATPTGDATALWPSATPIRFAGLLYLIGLLLALRGLRDPTSERRIRRHLPALAFYLAALWTYELTAALAAAGLLVYLVVAPPRRAFGRWMIDMGLTLAAMAWTLTHTPKTVQDLGKAWDHAHFIVFQLWRLYRDVALPAGPLARLAGPLTIVIGAIGAVLFVRSWRGRDDGPAAAAARRWTLTGLIAFVYVMAAYVVFVPADFYYSPGAVNFGNRVNGIGVAPMVLLAYSAVMVVASLAFWRRPRWAAGAIAVGLTYAVVGFVAHDRALKDHERQYVLASATARAAVDTIEQTIARPPSGTLVLTVGVPPLIAPDLPVFAATWDLQGALRLRYEDGTLDGFNAYQGFQCTPGTMTVPAGPSGSYGRTVVVDVPGRRAWKVGSPRECETVLAELAAAG